MSKIEENRRDLNLYEKYKQGDEKAFTILYNKYYEKVLKNALYLTKDENDAEDVTAYTFIKLAETQNVNDNFKGYLNAIARNRAIDIFRSRKKKREFNKELNQLDDVDGLENIQDIDIEQKISLKEMLEFIDKEVSLTDGERDVFQGYDVEGKSHKEVAKEQNRTQDSSKSLLNTARKKIRKVLRKMTTILM